MSAGPTVTYRYLSRYGSRLLFILVRAGEDGPVLTRLLCSVWDDGALDGVPVQEVAESVADEVGALQSVLWASAFSDRTRALLVALRGAVAHVSPESYRTPWITTSGVAPRSGNGIDGATLEDFAMESYWSEDELAERNGDAHCLCEEFSGQLFLPPLA